MDDGFRLMFDSSLSIACDFLCDVHAKATLPKKLKIADSDSDHLLLSSSSLSREPLLSAAVFLGKEDTVPGVSKSIDLDAHDPWKLKEKTSQQRNVPTEDGLSNVNNYDYK